MNPIQNSKPSVVGPLSTVTGKKMKEMDANAFYREVHQLISTAKRDGWSSEFLTAQIKGLAEDNPTLTETMDFPRSDQTIKDQIITPAQTVQNTEHLEFNITEGRLIHFDAKGDIAHSWKATTGNQSGKVSIDGNRGPLPPGYYGLREKPRTKTEDAFCDAEKNCWSQWLTPQFETSRGEDTPLSLHPDGNVPGTLGCVGLSENDTTDVKDILSNRSAGDSLPLIVTP